MRLTRPSLHWQVDGIVTDLDSQPSTICFTPALDKKIVLQAALSWNSLRICLECLFFTQIEAPGIRSRKFTSEIQPVVEGSPARMRCRRCSIGPASGRTPSE